jgi:hypothetical protein
METSSGCIPNIGPGQRRRRLVMGAVMALVAAVTVVWLMAADAPRAWRMLVLVPAWIGALDFLQVRARTCVLLAARGVRNMDAGNEPIASPAELQRVRAQARTVHIQSALLALAVAALVVAI